MERTLTEQLLEELLNYSEANVCDFKEQIYHIEEENSKISFLKDILAMANTIRSGSAFIIIGVRQKDGRNEFIGVDPNVDENNFISFIKSSVGPELPEFCYYTMEYKKHILGVFEIGISKYGPFYSKKTYGEKVIQEKIYYRYGSVNSEADDIMRAEIEAWMSEISNDNYKFISEQLSLDDKERYNYVLFVGEECSYNAKQYELVANMKWSLVIDFTRNSQENGLLKAYKRTDINRHLVTRDLDSIPEYYEGKSMIWFWAPAIMKAGTGKVDSRVWGREYFNEVSNCIRTVLSSMKKSVIFVSLFTGNLKETIVDSLVSANARTPLFLKHVDISWGRDYVVNDDPEYVDLQCLYLDFFEALKVNQYSDISRDKYTLIHGENVEITNSAWVHEEIEPVYDGIETMDEFIMNSDKSYYQGRELQWNEMNPCIAVNRRKYDELLHQIEAALSKNDSKSKVYYVDYEAGAGVTTVLKMVAWHFHEKYPVIMLKQYSREGTRARLQSLCKDVERRKLLLIVDIHDFDEQLLRELVRNAEVDNIPLVVLYSRRFLNGRTDNYLEEQLKGQELGAFAKIYTDQIKLMKFNEDQKEARLKVINELQAGESKYKTPFMFALCTYENDFEKLPNYVAARIGKMTKAQKKVLGTVALIHYYAGLETPKIVLEQAIKDEGVFRIDRVLDKRQQALLNIGDDGVKTLHHSVAQELLIQICASEMTNPKAWKNNLKKVMEDVIELLSQFKGTDYVLRILKALFLNQQPSKTKYEDGQLHFSYAIEDLPNNVIKKEILQLLCDKFPKYAFVFSNMGRYYHYVEEDEDLALECVQEALNLQEDYTFYHLKGIVIAKKFQQYISSNVAEIKADYKQFVTRVYSVLEDVERAYDKSIELNVSNTYGYTSKLNFYLKTVRNFQTEVCPDVEIASLLKLEKYYWCNEFISHAHQTLADMRMVESYMDTDMEEKIQNYENQVFLMEGNIADAISGWNNLLTKSDVYHPVIRRNLISGYYRECNKSWGALSYNKRERVREIISDNITEEPENANNIVQWFDFSRNFEDDLKKTVDFFQQYVSNPSLEYYFRGMLAFFAYGMEKQDKTYLKRGLEFSEICEQSAREKPNRRNLTEVYNPNNKGHLRIERYKKYLDKYKSYDEAICNIPKIQGRIVAIDKPEIGWILLEGLDIKIKFNPSQNSERVYRVTKDEATLVEFVLGFRYEGPFAYGVRDVKL